jgi:hypothetical protein
MTAKGVSNCSLWREALSWWLELIAFSRKFLT